MDNIDLKILNILQKDCMVSYKDIAKKIGLSYSPTYERIKLMEEAGIIKGRVTILDPNKVGIKFFVYCNIMLKKQSRQGFLDFEKAVSKIPEVMEVISLSGVYDYMLKVATVDIDAYNNFIMDKLTSISNISQYHSMVVLSIVKDETAYLLAEKD